MSLKHGDLGWNRTYVPIDINSFNMSYDTEFKTKESKFKPRIKLNHNINIILDSFSFNMKCSPWKKKKVHEQNQFFSEATAFFQCLLGKMRFLEFMKQPHSRERTIFALPIMHLLKTVFWEEGVKQGLWILICLLIWSSFEGQMIRN